LSNYPCFISLTLFVPIDLRLVKQIEVVDAGGTQDYNQTFVKLDAVGYWPKTSKTPQAKVTIFENTPNGSREKQIKIKHGTGKPIAPITKGIW